jgi:pyridoxine kinase
MPILSIQSRVASGYVGNAAAVPCLQCFGFDVAAVDTVVFSNHPADGTHTGAVVEAKEVGTLIDGLAERGIFDDTEAVLSGYLGGAATGPVVLDAVRRVKSAHPEALYCLDPVMGDKGRLYVDPALPEFFRKWALPTADIVIPNAFEAGQLLGQPPVTAADAVPALQALRACGPRWAVITGLPVGDEVETAALGPEGGWRVRTPRVACADHGAGDAFAAIFLGTFLRRGHDLGGALAHAAGALHGILQRTAHENGDDLALIAARAEIESPTIPAKPIKI